MRRSGRKGERDKKNKVRTKREEVKERYRGEESRQIRRERKSATEESEKEGREQRGKTEEAKKVRRERRKRKKSEKQIKGEEQVGGSKNDTAGKRKQERWGKRG